MNTKRNNKGFSLVELIVVIAVMAVLVGVLAPAYLRYVDKAKLQKDVSAVAEVVEAIKIAAAEEDVSDEIVTKVASGTQTYTTVKIAANGAITTTGIVTKAGTDIDNDLLDEIKSTVGESINLSSSAMTGTGAEVSINVYKDANHSLIIDVRANNKITGDAQDDLDKLDEL